MGLMFIISLLALFAGARSAWLQRAASRIEKMRHDLGAETPGRNDFDEVAKEFDERSGDRGLGNLIRNQWGEFAEACIDLPDGGLGNRLAAEEFFRDEEIMRALRIGPISFADWRLFPGILTTIGLIGTFAGIYLGFDQIPKTPPGQSIDPQQILDKFDAVIGGFSVAFETTLYALMMALVVHLVGTFLEDRVRRRVHGFRETLDLLVKRVTAEGLLARGLKLQGSTSEGLDRLAAALEEQTPLLRNMESHLATGLTLTIETFADHARVAIEQAANAGVAAAEKHHQQLMELTRGSVAPELERIAGAAAQVREAMTAIAERLDAAAGSCAATVDTAAAQSQAAADVVEQARLVAGEAAQAAESLTAQASAAAAANEQVRERLDQATALFADMHEDIRNSAQTMRESAGQFERTLPPFTAGLGDVTTAATGLASTTGTAAELIGHAGERVQNAASTLDRALAELASRQDLERRHHQMWRELAAVVSAKVDLVSNTMDSLTGVTRALEAERSALAEQQQQLSSTLRTIDQSFGTLRTSLDGVGAVSAKFDVAAQTLTTATTSVESTVNVATDALRDWVSTSNSVVDRRLNEFETLTAEALRRNADMVANLDELARHLVAVTGRLQRQPRG